MRIDELLEGVARRVLRRELLLQSAVPRVLHRGLLPQSAVPRVLHRSVPLQGEEQSNQWKRPRKSEVPLLHDGRQTRNVYRLCQAFAQMLPGKKKGRLLLAAARKLDYVMAPEDAARLGEFEQALFQHGAEMESLKEALAMLFETRDKFAGRSERLSANEASACLLEFTERWLGPVSGLSLIHI